MDNVSQPTQRTARITGAASGIGADLARAFYQAGYQLVLADLNLPQYLSDFDARAQDVCFVQADLSRETSCQDIRKQAHHPS